MNASDAKLRPTSELYTEGWKIERAAKELMTLIEVAHIQGKRSTHFTVPIQYTTELRLRFERQGYKIKNNLIKW
jgi:hypothetical protein